MENTLLVGDFLFVNKAAYGGELEIPLTGLRFLHVPGYAEPQHDRVVIFRSVEDSTPNLDIVKRVIGAPGDTLQMIHDTVFRNGRRLDEPYALHLAGGATPRRTSVCSRSAHCSCHTMSAGTPRPTTLRPMTGDPSRSPPTVSGSWAIIGTNRTTADIGAFSPGRTSSGDPCSSI